MNRCLLLASVLIFAGWAVGYAAPPMPTTMTTEAEGYSCMGYDKSRKETEADALTNARRNAVEKAKTFIASETRLKNFQLEKDIVSAYANASVRVLEVVDSSWYRDAASGDCYKVKINAEVTPDVRSASDDPGDPQGFKKQIEQKGIDYSADHFLEAAADGRAELVTLFLKAGIDTEARHTKDRSGLTALMWATIKGHRDIVKILIDGGADVNARDHRGETALMDAAERGRSEIVLLLIGAGADLGKYGPAALVKAARKGHMAIVGALLANGVDASSEKGGLALVEAAHSGHVKIVTLLLDKGADINARDFAQYTPLIRAAETDRIDTVKLLLARGADKNARDKFGYTALLRAAQDGRTAPALHLIDNRVDLDVKTHRGDTALIRAVQGNRTEIAKALIQAGADVRIPDANGKTALDWAKAKNREEIIALLEEKGK